MLTAPMARLGSVGRCLQVVEGARPALFLADVNRYYDMAAIETRFTVTVHGPVYRLTAK